MKIGIYFNKQLNRLRPNEIFKKKSKTYREFLNFGKSIGHEVYLVSGVDYKGNGKFGVAYKYGNDFFEEIFDVKLDCIYDKSTDLSFPQSEKNVINDYAFKKFCADKSEMQKLLAKFMPRYEICQNIEETKRALKKYNQQQIIVCKPFNGMGGKGVLIGKASEIMEKISDTPYVIQEFVDTSNGIKGITDGMHDLRIVLCNGKALFSHVRTPGPGKLVSNASGNKIAYIDLKKIPVEIMDLAFAVEKVIKATFGDVIFSVDIGVQKEKLYVFEINDIFGFPGDSFHNKKIFFSGVYELADRKCKSQVNS